MRFPGFEGEWEHQRMGDLGDFTKGAPLSKADISDDGTPFILYGELYTTYGEIIRSVTRRTNAETDNKYKSRNGDVIIPTSGETPEEIATASCVMPEGVILGGDLNIFRGQKVDGRFLAYLIRHKASHRIARIAQGVSIVHVSSFELRRVVVSIPSPHEQEKIVAFLDLLDARITAQRKLVELLKKHKKGVIEQIFGRRLSIGDNPEKWGIVKLRDLFKKVARRNRDGIVKNVITNSAEYGLIPQRNFFDKSIAVDGNTDGYYVIRTGDFVYNPRKSIPAPFGPFNRYTGVDDGIISPLYTCLVLAGKANPDYLAWYFRSTAWHRYVYDNGSQGARHDRVNMTDDLLFGIPVLLPPGNIQTWIADMLNSIDARVSDADKALTQLETMKRGLLQQLFA